MQQCKWRVVYMPHSGTLHRSFGSITRPLSTTNLKTWKSPQCLKAPRGLPLFGCLLAWTLVLAPCFFISPFLGFFLFIKVGRVSSSKTYQKRKGWGGKNKKPRRRRWWRRRRKPRERRSRRRRKYNEEKACYNGIFDRTTRNPKLLTPWNYCCSFSLQRGSVGCPNAMTLKSGIVIGDLH